MRASASQKDRETDCREEEKNEQIEYHERIEYVSECIVEGAI